MATYVHEYVYVSANLFTHVCVYVGYSYSCRSITCDMFQWCTISATGSLATEHPHPRSPNTGGFMNGIV